MKRFFNKYAGIVILIAVVLLCVAAFPLGLFKTSYVSGDRMDTTEWTLVYGSDDKHKDDESISSPLLIEGELVPEKSGLRELAFRFNTRGDAIDGKLTLKVYDSYGEVVDEIQIGSYDAMNYHWACFPLSGKYEKGQTYSYDLVLDKYKDASISVATIDGGILPAETQAGGVGDEDLDGRMPLIRYTYRAAVDTTAKLPFYVAFMTLGLFAYGIWRVIKLRRSEKSSRINDIQRLVPWLFIFGICFGIISMRDVSKEPVKVLATDMKSNNGWESDSSVGINRSSEYRGEFLKSDRYVLRKGNYTFEVAYHVESPTEEEQLYYDALIASGEYEAPDPDYFLIYDGDKKLVEYELDEYSTIMSFDQELEQDCADINFRISFGGGNQLLVDSVAMVAERGFYTDATFLKLLLIVIMALAGAVTLLVKRGRISIKQAIVGGALVAIGLAGSVPYLSEGLKWAIDLNYHLARIEGIKDGLAAGQFPVVIYPNALAGNGYLNLMYPAGLLYPAAIIHNMGVSLADSYKFVMILAGIACAAFTYMAVKSMSGSTQAGILAAILYTLAPYRFTNLYARGAVGEALAMTFLPLLFAGLYHVLLGKSEKWTYLAVAMTGLLYCHVLSFVMGVALCVIFALFFIRRVVAAGRYIPCMKAGGVTLILGAGFYVPFLDCYMHENLWKEILAENAAYETTAVRLPSLFGQLIVNDYHQLSLGLTITICGIIAVFGAVTLKTMSQSRIKRESLYGFLSFMTVLGCVFLFMVCEFFPNTDMAHVSSLGWMLENFQFAWRLLGPSTIIFVMAGSIYLYKNPISKNYAKTLFVVLVAMSLISAGRYEDQDYIYKGHDYTEGHLEKIVGIPVRDAIYPFEWRLRGTTAASVSYEPVVSDEDDVSVISYERKGTTSTLVYKAMAPDSFVEIPVQAYRGYKAEDDILGDVETTVGSGNRIRIPATADSMEHTVTVRYHMPITYIIFNWLSVLGMIGFAIFLVARDKIVYALYGEYEGDIEEAGDDSLEVAGRQADKTEAAAAKNPMAAEEDQVADEELSGEADVESDIEENDVAGSAEEVADGRNPASYEDTAPGQAEEEVNAEASESEAEANESDAKADGFDEADESDEEDDETEEADEEAEDDTDTQVEDMDEFLLERNVYEKDELEGMEIIDDATVNIPFEAIERALSGKKRK